MAENKYAIAWDEDEKRLYETGCDRGVLYVKDGANYGDGVPWNGLTKVTEKPTGAEATKLYANNHKYINLMSVEEVEASLECYTYPDEFAACDGSATIAKGVTVGQQTRKIFGLCYRTIIGNDTKGEDFGYKIHLLYGAQASPSEKGYGTVNDSPEAITFTYELKTTPVEVGEGFKPTASLIIDSTKTDADKLAKLEEALYGKSDGEIKPKLLLPSEVVAIVGAEAADLNIAG